MTELVIKQDELLQLNNLLGELPYKSAAPMVNFINAVAQRRQQEEQQELAKREIKNSFVKSKILPLPASDDKGFTSEGPDIEIEPTGSNN
jgi:hypothetical protein